jgi:hypothetical protein
MKDNTLDIKTVCECNRCLGCKTLHPQVSIINLENPSVYQDAVKFEFYAILLIEDCEGDCDCCGRIMIIPMLRWYFLLPARYSG